LRGFFVVKYFRKYILHCQMPALRRSCTYSITSKRGCTPHRALRSVPRAASESASSRYATYNRRYLDSPLARHAYSTVKHRPSARIELETCAEKSQPRVSDANRGRVLKHATRAARRTRVLVLGLIRADVLLTRR